MRETCIPAPGKRKKASFSCIDETLLVRIRESGYFIMLMLESNVV